MTQGAERVRVGWVLNLAADLELAGPEAFALSDALRARVHRRGEEFLASARTYSGESVEHLRLTADTEVELIAAWCPTPAARAAVHALGQAHRIPAWWPDTACLQRVNRRDYRGGEATPSLTGAAHVRSLAELSAAFDAHPNAPDGWLLKRAFGFSGRGHRRVHPPLDAAATRWIDASFTEHGGLLRAEPFVPIDLEVALHGWIDPVDKHVRLGSPTELRCNPDGGWEASVPAAESLLTEAELEELRATAKDVARDLSGTGYCGPFGIDAYRWRQDGLAKFNPLGEVNARFTMGYFAGLRRHSDWLIRRMGEAWSC